MNRMRFTGNSKDVPMHVWPKQRNDHWYKTWYRGASRFNVLRYVIAYGQWDRSSLFHVRACRPFRTKALPVPKRFKGLGSYYNISEGRQLQMSSEHFAISIRPLRLKNYRANPVIYCPLLRNLRDTFCSVALKFQQLFQQYCVRLIVWGNKKRSTISFLCSRFKGQTSLITTKQ